MYTALKTGVVDGAENNWPSYDTARHYEVAKYYAITDHSMAPEMLLMSKKVWDTLTPRGADDHPRRGQGVGALHAQAVGRGGDRIRKKVEAGGAQVIEVDKKSFADAMPPVYDKFITDPKLKDMVQKVKATQ